MTELHVVIQSSLAVTSKQTLDILQLCRGPPSSFLILQCLEYFHLTHPFPVHPVRDHLLSSSLDHSHCPLLRDKLVLHLTDPPASYKSTLRARCLCNRLFSLFEPPNDVLPVTLFRRKSLLWPLTAPDLLLTFVATKLHYRNPSLCLPRIVCSNILVLLTERYVPREKEPSCSLIFLVQISS